MNIFINNIGHYRITDYGRKDLYDLFNRQTKEVWTITRSQYEQVMDHMSVEACEFVEQTLRQVHV